MVYRTGNMLLQEVQRLHQGKVNDVIICQDLAADTQTYYTVLVIKDHNVAKTTVEIYEKAGEAAQKTYITGFTWQQSYLMVFPYRKERQIGQFLHSDVQNVQECEQICKNIVMECMALGIPYPILYMQLKQEQLHMNKDGNVYFGYCLNLEQINSEVSEKDCVIQCGTYLFNLLESISSDNAASYQLLMYKNMRGSYRKFVDLYKDLQTTSEAEEKVSLWSKIKKAFGKIVDRLFGILLVLSIAVFAIGMVMLVSQIIYADIPFMRMFINSFERIGTESLIR